MRLQENRECPSSVQNTASPRHTSASRIPQPRRDVPVAPSRTSRVARQAA